MNDAKRWGVNKTKGDMVERVVSFLINSTEVWECIPYGMENHIEQLRKHLKEKLDDTSRRIKCMPDFVAINKKTNEIVLIDVKYRSFIDKRQPPNILYGFRYGQIKDYIEFWKDTKLLIVHPQEPNFIVVNVKDIEWHKHFFGRTYYEDRMQEQWNFAGIQKDIKEVFPELTEEHRKQAVNMLKGCE